MDSVELLSGRFKCDPGVDSVPGYESKWVDAGSPVDLFESMPAAGSALEVEKIDLPF